LPHSQISLQVRRGWGVPWQGEDLCISECRARCMPSSGPAVLAGADGRADRRRSREPLCPPPVSSSRPSL